MDLDNASRPRMPQIDDFPLLGPVGVLEPCCTTTSERTGRWTKMLRSRAKFSEPEPSNHTPSLVAFITITPELKFSVHTAMVWNAVNSRELRERGRNLGSDKNRTGVLPNRFVLGSIPTLTIHTIRCSRACSFLWCDFGESR